MMFENRHHTYRRAARRLRQVEVAMSYSLPRAFDDGDGNLRGKITALYVALIAANLAAWAWALIAFHNHPVLLATCLLAYSFGLRHGVDADHIAAIDNATRKLMQDGERPVALGLYFSLGHSTVVVLATIGVALAAAAFKDRLDGFQEVGGLIGTSVAAAFLLIIAAINVVILVNVYRAFQRVKRGGDYVAADVDAMLANGGGVFTRLFRRLFGLIGKSRHMYPLGFLFGLGFDTATEIGLLTITAVEASNGLPLWSILVFPALFAAGMTLIDTTDSVLMVKAYGWAFVNPVRKLYYNLTITFASVVVAVAIGGALALGLIAEKLGLKGGVWDAIEAVNEFGALGYLIVGFFVVCWIGSMLIYRLKGYDRLDARFAQPAE
jgi:high-affinity nickel-transport protein